ncbi:zinc finger, CCHC-type containing protein [Tanacetum coccineum]
MKFIFVDISMDVAAMKHMASNFSKLDKFEGVDFRRWQKKMHFLLSSMSVVYVLTTHILDYGNDAIVDQLMKRAKWDNDDYVQRFNPQWFTQHKMNMDEAIQVSYIIEKLPPSWNDFKHTLKHLKEKLTLVELGSHLRIEESLRMQDSDKQKRNNVVGPSVVNMVEHNNSSRYNVNKENDTWKKVYKGENVGYKAIGWAQMVQWMVLPNRERCCFKTYESLNNGSILHMGNESTALVHGRGCVDIRFSSGILIAIDVKTTFLNGELDEEVYMNQPQGFIMPGNEYKACKLIKSRYGLKQAPKQWHQIFDEVVLSNGYLLNQADKCVYRKFDESGYTSNPGTQHWQAIQGVLKYLKKTMDYRLTIYWLSFSVGECSFNASWISNTEDIVYAWWVILLASCWLRKLNGCKTCPLDSIVVQTLASILSGCDSAVTLAKAF